jgi:gluconokinase
LHPSYLPARIAWLKRTRLAVARRVRHWMSAAEYLALRLFGELRVSLSMASATGLFDQHALSWDADVLAALDLTPDELSPLADLDAPFTALRGEFARRWPALARVPWLPAAGDGACANVGSGCVSAERAALSLGTSGALRVLFRRSGAAERVEVPRGLWLYRLDRDRLLVGGAISNGGSVRRWLAHALALPPAQELERTISELPADGHGLTVLPFLAGERSPDWSLSASSAVVGLTLNTTPAEIVRAAMEAVAYRLVIIRRLLAERFPEARTVVASGGALAHSPTWARIIADALGEPIELSRDEEASLRGAALLALESAGAIGDVADRPPPAGERVMPDAGRHARYAAAIERYRSLDRLIAERWSVIADR